MQRELRSAIERAPNMVGRVCTGTGKRPLGLESSGSLLNSTKNIKYMEGSKEN